MTPSKNTPEIGSGVYSVPDAADILGFPIDKIRRWIKSYWENKFIDDGTPYTWGEGRERGFNFHTLVELIAICIRLVCPPLVLPNKRRVWNPVI